MNITRSIRALLFVLALLAISAAAFAQSISVSIAPPELPVYEQPLLPGEGYIWTPGYWAYAGDDDGYFWVPGTWVMAPEPGLLWTPAYWGWSGNGYAFHQGYWGEQVGFYGGVSYGYGYYGDGYQGGRWQNGQFYYNRSVNNVNVTNIHNVYNTTINNTTVNRVSYNGGNGGISARPTHQQESIEHERHIPPVAAQTQHEQAARTNPTQRASVNHGTPTVAATSKPGAFSDNAVVHAKATGTPYVAPVRAAVQPANTPGRPENNAARGDRTTPNNTPENRAPIARPNYPEPNKPEPNRPSTVQPERQPETSRSPAAQPNNRPEPNREPSQRPFTPPPSERSQPERAAPPSEPRVQQQPEHQQQTARPEEKKSQEEKPKQKPQ